MTLYDLTLLVQLVYGTDPIKAHINIIAEIISTIMANIIIPKPTVLDGEFPFLIWL